MDDKELYNIQKLVGNISHDDLMHVDCYISNNLGIFIPSIGFCKYAIKSKHTHPTYSFVLFFTKEQNIIPINIEVQPNHYLMAALSPDIPHEEVESDVFTRYMALFISKDIFEKQYYKYCNENIEKYNWKQFLVREDIMFYLKKFMFEYENKFTGYEQILESLAFIITNELVRSLLNIRNKSDIIIEKVEFERVTEYMQQNFSGKLSNAILSKYANMSESHFIRTFKKEANITPMGYLLRIRMERAKKMLKNNNESITEISFKCGFNSASHFSTSFVKNQGLTPSVYREKYVYKNK